MKKKKKNFCFPCIFPLPVYWSHVHGEIILSQCCKRSTSGQNDLKFELNIHEETDKCIE